MTIPEEVLLRAETVVRIGLTTAVTVPDADAAQELYDACIAASNLLAPYVEMPDVTEEEEADLDQALRARAALTEDRWEGRL